MVQVTADQFDPLPSGQVTPDQFDPPPSGPMAGAQAYFGQVNAAQQGTSPVVRDAKGNLNYNRLGSPIDTDAGPGYIDSGGKWQIVDPTRHVMLTDPATGRMTVFERNQEMEENRATSLGRLASFGVLPGSPAVPVGQAGSLAQAVGSPFVKTAANAATGAASGWLAQRLGMSPEIAGILGMALGFGPHATGGGFGGDATQWLSRLLANRSLDPNKLLLPPVMNPGTAAIPGLLNTATGAASQVP